LAGKPEEQRLLITITNIFNGQHRVDTLSWNELMRYGSGRLDGRSVRPFHESSYLQPEHYGCSNTSSSFIRRRKYKRGLSSHGGTEVNEKVAKGKRMRKEPSSSLYSPLGLLSPIVTPSYVSETYLRT
jgi:hypothetical protein